MNHHGPGVFVDPGAASLLQAHPEPRRALFLDRDGVINVDRAYVHRSEDTEWIPGIFEFCRTARDAGYLLIVVTNQAGIARGLYDEAQFRVYTRWMHGEFDQQGVPLLATWYCPHHPTAGIGLLRQLCDCRKPAPGMLLRAAQHHGVCLAESLLIGDKASDLEAGSAAGLTMCMWLGTQTGGQTEHDSGRYVETMAQAQQVLTAHVRDRSTRASNVNV